MEKTIGVILLVLATAAVVFAVFHFKKASSLTLPIPEKIVNFFKVEPFKDYQKAPQTK